MKKAVISGSGLFSKYAVNVETFMENITSKNIKKLYSEDELKETLKEMINNPPLDKYDLSNWRSMDQLTRTAVVASLMAVENSGLNLEDMKGTDTGIFFGTVFGCIESNIKFNQKLLTASPRFVSRTIFCNTVSNAAVGHIGLILKAKGMHATFASGGAYPLIYGLQQLKKGTIKRAIVGGMEKLESIVIDGLKEFNLIAEGTKRNGFYPHEGAGALILEDLESCLKRKGRVLAEVKGYGVGKDFKTSMEQALKRANLPKDSIQLLILFDNQTSFSEEEKSDIEQAFNRAENKPYLYSIKEEIGEAFGASPIFSLIGGISLLSQYDLIMINTASFDCRSRATFIIQSYRS